MPHVPQQHLRAGTLSPAGLQTPQLNLNNVPPPRVSKPSLPPVNKELRTEQRRKTPGMKRISIKNLTVDPDRVFEQLFKVKPVTDENTGAVTNIPGLNKKVFGGLG